MLAGLYGALGQLEMGIGRSADIDDVDVVAGKEGIDVVGECANAEFGDRLAAAVLIKRAQHRNLEQILVPVVACQMPLGDAGSDHADAQFPGHVDISLRLGRNIGGTRLRLERKAADLIDVILRHGRLGALAHVGAELAEIVELFA